MDILSNEQLATDVKAFVADYETKHLEEAELIMADDSIPIIERISKIKLMPNSVDEQQVLKQDVRKVLLFNGKLYASPITAPVSSKSTTSRVRGGGRFQVGQAVQLKSGEHASEIYNVGEDGNVYNSEGKPFKASILTKLFHTEILGKSSNWDMAGLSHNYWVAVE